MDRSALRTKDREGAGPNGGRAGGRAGGSADHTLPHYIKSVMKTAARIDRQTDIVGSKEEQIISHCGVNLVNWAIS